MNTSAEVARGARQQETLLQRQRQLLGEALPDEPLDHDRVAVTDQARTASAAVTTLSLTDVPDKDSAGMRMVFLLEPIRADRR